MRYLHLFLLLVAMTSTALSQDALWRRTYGGPRFDRAMATVESPDGGYLITGISQGVEGEPMTMRGYLLKIDGNGNLAWEKRFSDSGQALPHAIFRRAGGGYIVFGNAVHPTNISVNSPYAAVVAADGTILREKRYGAINSNQLMDGVARTLDSGFVATGSNDAGVTLLRFDREGEMLWERFYHLPGHRGFAVEQMADGGFTITGARGSTTTGYSSFLLRTGETGDSLWLRGFTGSSDTSYSEFGEALFESDGGDLLVVGSTSEGGRAIYAATLTADGTLRSSSRIGLPSYFHTIANVRRSPRGGFLIVGNASYQSNSYSQLYLARLEENGALEWEITYGIGAPNDTTWQGSDVIESGENEYTLVGARVVLSGNLWDAVAMRIRYLVSGVTGETKLPEILDLR